MEYFYSDNGIHYNHKNVRLNHISEEFDVHIDTVLYDGTPAVMSIGSYKDFDEAMLKWREFDDLIKHRRTMRKRQDLNEIINLVNSHSRPLFRGRPIKN